MNTLTTMLNILTLMIDINLIINILLALTLFQFVLTPLHRLMSRFIYRSIKQNKEHST